MSQITVRNLPEGVETRLRQLATKGGHSLNQTVVRLLEQATGVAPATGPKRDVTALAGRWSAAEASAFDAAVGIFEAVDPEVWQ